MILGFDGTFTYKQAKLICSFKISFLTSWLMSLLIQIIVLFIAMGSLHGIVLSYILGRRKLFDKKSNRYLSLFILAFSLSNLHYVAKIFGTFENYSWLNYLTFPWTFLIPIVFYLFIVYLLNPDFQLKKSGRWLFVPFILQLVFHIVLSLLDFFDSSLLDRYQELIYFIDIKLETVFSLLLTLIFIPLVLFKLTSKKEKNYIQIQILVYPCYLKNAHSVPITYLR